MPPARARLLAGRGQLLWLLGAVALAMPWLAGYVHAAWPGAEFLNGRAFNWLGLVSHKPVTEDYAPVFPWLGVMCFGLAVGPALSQSAASKPVRGLAWLGRWSLSYYMLHQPVLIGVLSLVALLR